MTRRAETVRRVGLPGAAPVAPRTTHRDEDGGPRPLVVWRFDSGRLAASTASVGGGLGVRQWAVNAEVEKDYARTDLATHAAEIAQAVGLAGRGMTMFTAARVRRMRHAECHGVRADVTVGLSDPTWAVPREARGHAHVEPPGPPPASRPGIRPDIPPGTINIVAQLPVRLTEAALLAALCTVTEAKTQALIEAGVSGTGTPTDAVVVICPTGGTVAVFGGVRSTWGSRLARVVHRATLTGARAWSGASTS